MRRNVLNRTEKHRTYLLGFLLFTFVGLLSSPSFATFIWDPIQSLPTPRQVHSAVGTSDAVYVFGGNTGGPQTSGFTADAYKFSESSDTWTTIASMPKRVGAAGVAALGDYVYVIGGSGHVFDVNPALSSVYRYSPDTNSWDTMASLNQGRRQAGSVALDGYIYAVGGVSVSWSIGTPTTRVEKYDPTSDSWSDVEPLPEGQAPGVVAAVDGYIYSIGGTHLTGYRSYRYSSSTGWERIADAPFPIYPGYASQILDGHGHIVIFPTDLTQSATYNPSLDTWTVAPNTLNVPRTHQWGLAATSSYLYLVGGSIYIDSTNTALDASERASKAAEPIPEPSTILLLATGLAGMGAYGLRRRKKA